MNTAQKLKAFATKQLALLVDDSGDQKRVVFLSPAGTLTEERAAFILNHAGGHFFVALSEARCNSFMIPRMEQPSSLAQGELLARSSTFLSEARVSVEAREGVGTGISAADRATTVRALASKDPSPRAIVKPGHVFPVQVKDGGLLVKNSFAEAAYDTCILSEYDGIALFCEALNPQGEFFNEKELVRFARDLELPLITISELISYRIENEQIIERIVETKLPTHLAGQLRALVYKSKLHDTTHLALVKGDIDEKNVVLTRVQPEFTIGDIFSTKNPPTRESLDRSLSLIGERGAGVLLYLRKPESGQLELQVADWESNASRPPASTMREYGLGAQILRDIGVKRIELLTRSKRNLVGLKPFGIEIVKQQSLR
jgi:3,4-dihydroxy 2-butanone 4-phosphate synthase/GTP cyclohydrolase II